MLQTCIITIRVSFFYIISMVLLRDDTQLMAVRGEEMGSGQRGPSNFLKAQQTNN